ncbi:hypothetical protein P0R31_36910 [Bradyrhizobium yuanmingense]|uniref:hypothetical protein n=1 Tax=Bradyrhizobium yuanmingense TaxID=108015 RepID=UPI0023B8922D|nr:hypothetical protein [Bradyrhizobium yuanmingense]MDF0522819.1 hypothetical protein [Bradyrhizobium yuanmingense]
MELGIDGFPVSVFFDVFGDKIEVSVPTGYSQYFLNPTIALANGGFAVTWTDPDGLSGDASGTAILAQAFNAAGEKIGGEFLVNTNTNGHQVNPSITALADGGFAISWQDGDQYGFVPGSSTLGDSSGASIKVQVFGISADNIVEGTAGTDTFIGSGIATMSGNGGNDTFIFRSGQADGDTIADFIGNGASSGDMLIFKGFGTSGEGATFTQVSEFIPASTGMTSSSSSPTTLPSTPAISCSPSAVLALAMLVSCKASELLVARHRMRSRNRALDLGHFGRFQP